METFTLVTKESKVPADEVRVAEGETIILAIKKPKSVGADVSIYCESTTVAGFDYVLNLKDASKRSLIDHFTADSIPMAALEENGLIFLQVIGLKVGRTVLKARFNKLAYEAYASPVGITVTENSKRFQFTPPVSFKKLWDNHPYIGRQKVALCGKDDHNECMIRFCETLRKTDDKLLTGLHGSHCPGKGKNHQYHFTNPYNFADWKHLKDAYVWKTDKALHVSEPMPGYAAQRFIRDRFRGVIVFYNYFTIDNKMIGGHIDLYNGRQMGNNLIGGGEPEGAFFRSEKVAFWPMEAI